MKDKLRVLGNLWFYTWAVSVSTMIVFHIVPAFGRLFGDLIINCDSVNVPILSCALFSAAAVGVWAYVNRGRL